MKKEELRNIIREEVKKVVDEAFGFGRKNKDVVKSHVDIKKNLVYTIFNVYKHIKGKDNEEIKFYRILSNHNLEISYGPQELYKALKPKRDAEIIDISTELQTDFSKYLK